MDLEVLKITKNYPGVFTILDGNKKLICNLTKHEIANTREALTSYIEGKKFKRIYGKLKAPEKYLEKVDVKYKEFFVPSRRSKSRVFCKLTKKEMNDVPYELEQHIAGYRFKKAYFFFKEGKLELKNEGENELDEKEENEEIDSGEEDGEVPLFMEDSGSEEEGDIVMMEEEENNASEDEEVDDEDETIEEAVKRKNNSNNNNNNKNKGKSMKEKEKNNLNQAEDIKTNKPKRKNKKKSNGQKAPIIKKDNNNQKRKMDETKTTKPKKQRKASKIIKE